MGTLRAVRPLVLLAVLSTAAFLAGEASARAADSVYVATGAGDVWQFDGDPATGALSPKSPASIAAGFSPRGVAVSPDGKSAYVTANPNKVSQYDVSALTGGLSAKATPSVATGSDPVAIAVSPDGRNAYVANQSAASVSQYGIDAATGALSPKSPATIGAGSSPRGVAVSPDGLSAYVVNGVSASVSQYDIDPVTGNLSPKATAAVATGAGPLSVALSPDGASAYVSNGASGSVSQYDVDAVTGGLSPKPTASVGAGAGAAGLVVSPDGKHAFVANQSAAGVSQYDVGAVSGALTPMSPATVATSSSPTTLAVTPDGRSVYAGHSNAAKLSQFDVSAQTGALSPKAPATVGLGANPMNNPTGLAAAGASPFRSTTTRVSCSPATATVDAPSTTCTATVTDTSRTPAPPTGQVRFSGLGAGASCSPAGATAAVSCSVVLTASATGSFPVVASYVPDATSYVASRGASTFTVEKRSSSTAVGCAPDPVLIGTAARCTATVTDSGGGQALVPGGTVELTADGASLGSCTLEAAASGPAASCSVDFRPGSTGAHAIAAQYAGGAGHTASAGSTSVTAEAARSVYVVNRDSDDASQYSVDSSTGGLVPKSPATIAATLRPYAVAVSPDGRSAYTTNLAVSAVLEYDIDPLTGALARKPAGSVGMSSGSRAIAVSPDGRSVYATSSTASDVAQFDADATGALSPKAAGHVGVAGSSQQIVLTPDGRSAYVTTRSSDAVWQFDVDPVTGALAPKLQQGLAAGSSPAGIAVRPDGRSAYVVDTGSDSVEQFDIDPVTGALSRASTAAVAAGASPQQIVVSPDGRSAYITDQGSNSVSQYDVDAVTGALSPKSPATVASGTGPHGVALSLDGSSAYVTDQGANSVSQYDVDSLTGALSPKVVATVGAGTAPAGIAVGPPVGRHATGTGVTCSPAAIAVDETTTCTATVTDSSATPTTPAGRVSFSGGGPGEYGGGVTCALAGIGASASCSVPFTARAAGGSSISATYAGGIPQRGSTGSTAISKSKRSTSTTVACSPDVVSVDRVATCTARVRDTEPGSTSPPTGTVAFSSASGGVSQPSCALVAGAGEASCSVDYSAASPGEDTVLASYGASAKHGASSGSAAMTAQGAGTLYVANTQENTVGQYGIDAPTGALTPKTPASLAAAHTPIAIALSPDGRSAYVPNVMLGSGEIAQYDIDPLTGKLSPKTPAVIAAPEQPDHVVVSPDGRSLYTTDRSPPSISQYDIDPQTGALSAKATPRFAAGSNPDALAVTPDGGTVFVVDTDGILQYDADGQTGELTPKATPKVVVHDNAGVNLRGIAVTPDGRSTYVTINSGVEGGVLAFDVDPSTGALTAKSPSRVAAGGRFPSAVVVAPDGRSAYVGNYNDRSISQYRVDALTGALAPMVPATIVSAARPTSMAMSVDGASLYVADESANEGGIWQFDVDVPTGALAPKSPAVVGGPTGPQGIAVGRFPAEANSTATSVACSPAVITYGGSTTCTATVTDTSPPQTTPTGQITFTGAGGSFSDGAACTPTGSGSSASCSVQYTPSEEGSSSIGAAYGGDATHGRSTGSATVTATKPRRPTTSTVACAPDPAVVGAASQCTATVSDTGAGTASAPSGTVLLSGGAFSPDASCALVAAPSGASSACSLDYTPDTVGDHPIHATYAGSAAHIGSQASGSVSAIDPAPSVHLAAANPAVVAEGPAEQTFAYSIGDLGSDAISAVSASCGAGNAARGEVHTRSGGSFACVFPDGPATPAVQVAVTDSDGQTGTDSQTVRVDNVAPIVTLAPDNPTAVVAGSTERTFRYSVSDPGDDTLATPVTSCGAAGSKVGGSDADGSFRCVFALASAGTQVGVTVADSDSDGGSDAQTVTVRNAQTIDFPAPDDRRYGDAPFPVGPTASSGLPVDVTATGGACEVAGGLVTLVHAGGCSLRAAQGGDAQTAPAEPVVRSLTVARAGLTVQVQPAQMVYGDPVPAAAVSYSGLVSGDVASDLGGVLAFSTVGARPAAGSHTVHASGLASDDYAISYEDSTLEVTRRPVVLTGAAHTRPYGDRNPDLVGITEGLLPGDDVTTTWSTVATETSPVGGYAIAGALSGPDAGNYEPDVSPGDLQIERRPLDAVADDVSRGFGKDNPELTGQPLDVVNGDDVSARYSTTATRESRPGRYPIGVEVLGTEDVLGNYSVTTHDGWLTVVDEQRPTLVVPSLVLAEATGPGGPPAVRPPFLTAGRRLATIARSGRFTLGTTIWCPGDGPACKITATVTKGRRIGGAAFTVAAASKAKLSGKLTAAGRRLVGSRGKVRVKITLKVRRGGDTRHMSLTATLRAPPR